MFRVILIFLLLSSTAYCDVIYNLDAQSSGGISRIGSLYSDSNSSNLSRENANRMSITFYTFDLSQFNLLNAASATFSIAYSSITGSSFEAFIFNRDTTVSLQNQFNAIKNGQSIGIGNLLTNSIEYVIDPALLQSTFNIGLYSNRNSTQLQVLSSRLVLSISPEVSEVIAVIIGLAIILAAALIKDGLVTRKFFNNVSF